MGEMLAFLAGIALLGIICGWLFTRASYKHKIEDAEVALLSHLHNIQKELDITQQRLASTSERLEEEKLRNNVDSADLDTLHARLETANLRFDERKQQVLDLNQALEETTRRLQLTETNLEKQISENKKMTNDLGSIKQQLTIFQSDLDDIAEQSEILRNAFEQARLSVLERDRRIAELESASSEGLQMAALSGNSDPELAISRIGRLQTRVQELYDELTQKDQQLEALMKNNSSIQNKSSVVNNFLDLQADDLQQINGLGGTHEDALNKLGITRFSDIAAWDDEDIDRIDSKLKFKGQIRQNNWVEQARRICSGHSVNKGH